MVCSAIYVLAAVHLTAGVLGLGRLVVCGPDFIAGAFRGWMCSGGMSMFGGVPQLSLLVIHVPAGLTRVRDDVTAVGFEAGV